MTYFATVTFIGVLVFDTNKKLIDYKLFKGTPEEIAEKIVKYESGNVLDELEELKSKINGLSVKEPNPATEVAKENLRKLAIDLKFLKDDASYNRFLSQISVAKSKTKISNLERRDKLIIQCVSALNDLDKMLNLMTERIREWYGLHYPELRIPDHRGFVRSIFKYGKRENFPEYSKSMGVTLTEEDIKMIQRYSEELSRLYSLKDEMEKYLNLIVPKEIPNIAALLGVNLAAKLLAQAGSLERLAKMPSSTLQLLGAEKALFKFLKDRKGVKVPKHGLVFLHPDVSNAPRELRGKVARLLSSKLTMAARADFYSRKDISKELLQDYKEKLKQARL